MSMRRVLGYVIVALTLFFLGRALYLNAQSLQRYEWQLDYPRLVLAVLAAWGTMSLYVWQWQWIASRLGAKVSYFQAYRLWFLSNLARYLPGKVWQFVGWFYLGEQLGLSRMLIMTSLAVNLGLQTLSGLALGLATLTASRGGELASRFWPLLLLIPLGAIVLQPRLMQAALNWGRRRLGQEEVTLGLTTKDMALFTMGHVGCWTAYAVAFGLFVGSVYPVEVSQLPALGATYAAAWTIGFLGFLTPGGLGLREGALAYLLGFWLPTPVAIVVALLSRLWVTAGELLGAGLAWRLGPPHQPVSTPPVAQSVYRDP